MTAHTDTERLDARREQHTEGPWVVDDGACGPAVAGAVRAASGWYIASVYENGPNPAADQRLIAAAPDLLAALQPFANYACDEPDDCHNCRARAAIAKATVPNAASNQLTDPVPEGAGR